MKNEFIYVWGYNGLGNVDEEAKERRFYVTPHRKSSQKCQQRLPNSTSVLSQEDLRCGFTSNLDSIMSIKGLTDCHPGNLVRKLPANICQHEKTTYLIFANGLCHVIDHSHGNMDHSIVKGVVGKEKVNLKCVSAGDLQTVGITETHIAGYVTKEEETSHIFRPFVPSIACKQVSCGKEHVLLLSTNGQVYSYGFGSRGQLGHGVTDKQQHPKLIEALETVSIVNISSGGWHSAVVSDIHDLYIWGWNESGQLGFKMKNLIKRSNVKTNASKSKDFTPDPQKLSSCSDCVKEGGEFQELRQDTTLSIKKNVNDNAEKDEESVLFHLVPAILDLPEGYGCVSNVSCGSRHSAAVTDDGHLFTWGWGKYGQLGHGDRCTKDTPTLVQYFTRTDHTHLKVTVVLCYEWNTAVSVQVYKPSLETQGPSMK